MQNETIEAWLYTPTSKQQPQQEAGAEGGTSQGSPPDHSCLIMAHGLGGQKDFGLHPFADRFTAEGGLTTLIFDYRTFGGSDGEPRHWASPKRHVEDWEAAVQAMQVGVSERGWGAGGRWGVLVVAGQLVEEEKEWEEVLCGQRARTCTGPARLSTPKGLP